MMLPRCHWQAINTDILCVRCIVFNVKRTVFVSSKSNENGMGISGRFVWR